MHPSLYLYFDGLKQPLCLIGCDHLTKYFSILFPEWEYHPGKPHDNPIISIEFERDVYHLSTSWIDDVKKHKDIADILCTLVAKLVKACSFSDYGALYLHAGSVVINGRLVIFPSQQRAGKSFLTVCLAAAGYRYFGDDIVPLTLNHCKGRSLGFAPRLRIPIPITTDTKSKHFIESRTAIHGKRYAYITIDQDLRVPRGDLIDVGAFVLLDRQEGVHARLEELPAATILRQLIKHNFARKIDSSRILSTLSQVISQAQCIKISYDRADDAIRLLQEHFSHWPSQPSKTEKLTFNTANPKSKESEISSKDSFIQNSGIQKIRIENESFLTSSDEKAIYHLNMLGSGIWALLAEPISKDEIVSTLATAFPQVEKLTIEKDVSKIVKKLRLKNLICSSSVNDE